MYYSVICSEHEDFAGINKDELHLIPEGIDWEGNSRQEIRQLCALWNVKRSPDTLDEMPVSEIPTLLMSGKFDPVTPPRNGYRVINSFQMGSIWLIPWGFME